MNRIIFSLLFFVLSTHISIADNKKGPSATHGVATGEVTKNSAIIWSRTNKASKMFVKIDPDYDDEIKSVNVKASNDYTGKIRFRNLKPETKYSYKVWFEDKKGRSGKITEGQFQTAPRPKETAAVKITWSGDFAGQNVCRDAKEGFPIFQSIVEEKSDIFIGLGDMIYADNLCEAVGRYGNQQVPGDFVQSFDLKNFWAHWRYNREDAAFKQLLSRTPYIGIWDDHEVVNDFGPLADTRDTAPYVAGASLLPIGLKAFLDYNPIIPRRNTPNRLYRNIRWGKHAELFVLGTRQYRDANLAADKPGEAKTMLGREQLSWLKEKLKASTATWKIIVSSVPISIPTGFPQNLGRDGWANFDENTNPTIDGIPQSNTGFEQELIDILKTLRDEKANTLFITTDVHFAEVFRYTPFSQTPDFKVHEVVIGPGNAGIFPNRDFDKTLGTESLFFFGPNTAGDVTSWEEAKRWFNYGSIEIDESGKLRAQVKDTNGVSQYTLVLNP